MKANSYTGVTVPDGRWTISRLNRMLCTGAPRPGGITYGWLASRAPVPSSCQTGGTWLLRTRYLCVFPDPFVSGQDDRRMSQFSCCEHSGAASVGAAFNGTDNGSLRRGSRSRKAVEGDAHLLATSP